MNSESFLIKLFKNWFVIFVNWSHWALMSVEIVITEFYINSKVESDNIICFMCEIQLHHWELSDLSVIEHLQHIKDCWRIRIRMRIKINKIRIIEIEIEIEI